MNNPYRVTPPLVSDDIQHSSERDVKQVQGPVMSELVSTQSTASSQKSSGTVRIEAQVQMEPIQKTVQTNSASRQQGQDQEKKTTKAPNAFRTISEVAGELEVQQHVLRFWETKFTQIKPLKRGGGRRYYRPEDVALLKRIRHLLYTEGYTIKGVQKLLKTRGKAQIVAAEANNQNGKASSTPESQNDMAPAAGPKVSPKQDEGPARLSARQRAVLEVMLAELKSLRQMVHV